MAEQGRFSDRFRDFAASRWRTVIPVTAHRGAALNLRYVRNPITGLLVPESLTANPLPVPEPGTGPAPGVLPRELVVQQIGPVLVLPGPAGELPPGGLPRVQVPAGQVVVVAHSQGGQAVTGLLGQDGAAKGEMVPVPPAWMAEIILAARGYTPGAPVTFLVPGLGRPSYTLSLPEQYAQQVADLLMARVVAVTSDAASGSLSDAQAVFDPMPLVLNRLTDDAGGVRLISLASQLRDRANLGASAVPDGSLAAEVFLEAFDDGSLGLYYQGEREGAYPVSPWFIAQALAPAFVGRPFVIRPVEAQGRPVSRTRRDATIAEIHRQVALLTGGDPALAVALQRATDGNTQSLVRRLRLPLADRLAREVRDTVLGPEDWVADGLAREVRDTVLGAGDAVAGVYASLLEGGPMPKMWVADVQIPGGLWIRPGEPGEHVAAARAELTDLPQPPDAGLIIVGMTGRRVPRPVWQAVRRALEQVPEQDRETLRVRAIDTAQSAGRLAGLVTVEEVITTEAPPYSPQWHFSPLPNEPTGALPGGRSTLALPLPAKLASRVSSPGLAGPAALAVPALPGLIAAEAGKDRSDAGRAAGLEEFNAAIFDKAWGKLPGDPVRGDAVGRAVARARELIGRKEPVIGVRTHAPITELDPLGQAVRWLALQIYRNPGDEAGAQALARDLAARLEAVLPMAEESASGPAAQAAGGVVAPLPHGLEQAWKDRHQRLAELVDVPEPVADALARYGRAEQVLSGAQAALEEFDGRSDGPADPSALEKRLRTAVSAAQLELTEAHQDLTGLQVADPGAAWQEVTDHLGRLSGGGLPGGAMGVEIERHNVRLYRPSGTP